MSITATESVNGEDVQVSRLGEAGELEARQAFVWAEHGFDVSDSDFDHYMIRATVQYRDDYDAGTSEYQVYDNVTSHGDGWKKV